MKDNNSLIINNDIYNFMKSINISTKVGYYIPDSSIINFHPILFISTIFGTLNNSNQLFSNFNSNFKVDESLNYLLSYIFTKDNNNDNVKYVCTSLLAKMSDTTYIQYQRIYVAWFLAEIMYDFFFIQ